MKIRSWSAGRREEWSRPDPRGNGQGGKSDGARRVETKRREIAEGAHCEATVSAQGEVSGSPEGSGEDQPASAKNVKPACRNVGRGRRPKPRAFIRSSPQEESRKGE